MSLHEIKDTSQLSVNKVLEVFATLQVLKVDNFRAGKVRNNFEKRVLRHQIAPEPPQKKTVPDLSKWN
jgi:hypothetical protein